MHTFVASDGTVILYNPDLSEVKVQVHNVEIEDVTDWVDVDQPSSHVRVSGPALREFIAEYFRRQLIAELEQVDVVELLKDL